MYTLADKKALVIGLGRRGRAACRLLRRCDAGVMGIDQVWPLSDDDM